MKKFLLSVFAMLGMYGMAFAGDGSEGNPYDVDQVIAMGTGAYEADVYVEGYIVGSVGANQGMTYLEDYVIGVYPASKTNMMIASSSAETDPAYCIPVQLPSGPVRDGLNLQDNPANLGHKVILKGDISKYYGVPGFKSVTSYTWVGEAPEGGNPGYRGTISIDGFLLQVGDCITLTASITPLPAGDSTITWSSSNPSIASVNEKGRVKALSEGTVTIYAENPDMEGGSIDITIVAEETVPSSPVTLYVVGNDINGSQDWQVGSQLTDKGNGVYEWSGSELGKGFKINNGGWDTPEYNIGSDGTLLTVGTPFTYLASGDSQDIKLNGCDFVTDAHLTLDMKAGTITLTGTPGVSEPEDPSDITFYMIGSNVNGQSWTLAAPDAMFENLGNGLYRWEGEVLGTGFKINDGTWSNSDYNIGAPSGSEIEMGVPYYYWANGSSGNIAFAGDFTEIQNPVVELNLNEATITIVGGTTGGEVAWYITGINGVFDLTPDWELAPVEGEEGVYSRVITITETAADFKISDDGWAHQYGTNDPVTNFIDSYNLMVYLEPVYGEGGNVPYELEEGAYVVTFDSNELTVEFSKVSSSSVSNLISDKRFEVFDVFDTNGMIIRRNVDSSFLPSLEKGIYIIKSGEETMKIVK